MASDFMSVYEETATNSEIAAGGTASETFFSNNTARENVTRYNQSFNSLEINNDDANTVLKIRLDGLTTRERILFSKSNIVIEPESGIFFNTVEVINTHATSATSAGNVRLNARILKKVKGVN